MNPRFDFTCEVFLLFINFSFIKGFKTGPTARPATMVSFDDSSDDGDAEWQERRLKREEREREMRVLYESSTMV